MVCFDYMSLVPFKRVRFQQPLHLFALLCLFGAAQTPPIAYAAASSPAIAQGFSVVSTDNMVTGALVSTRKEDPKSVELATNRSTARLVGVIDKDALVNLSTGGKEAQVVLKGTTSMLVSDINGPIRAGDKLTTSPIAGVGMRATTDVQIAGTAQTDFAAASSQTRNVKDSAGKSHAVHIGYVTAQVGVAYYQAPNSNYLPPIVQRVANGIAGRPVSLIRITVSSLLLLLGLASVVVFIYTAVRSAMVALGRNPLASDTILKGLYQSITVAAVAAPAILLAAYLILTL